MPDNLLLISLDGVSQTAFWQYREFMPNLWRLSTRSIMFRRFYATSTSAFQAFCDLAFGDPAELDHNPALPDAPGCFAGRADNLFDLLHGRGFSTLGLQHGTVDAGYATRNYWGAWPDACGAFQHHQRYDAFHSAAGAFLERAKAGNIPFALYVSDTVARPDDGSPEKETATLYHERFEAGYSLLDMAVGRLLGKIADLGLLAGTRVVVFGPYGMDPWRHGIQRGHTMGMAAPYADIGWTPAFIHNNGREAGNSDQLFTVADLKPTLLRLLFPDEPQTSPRNPLSGLDILSGQRPFALVQNMPALMPEGGSQALGLVKSYGIVDGDMRLIVSSHGGIPDEGGMELYYDMRDPGNGRNFLDFFTLNEKGDMIEFGRNDIIHVHFTQSFRPNLVFDIVKSYNALREVLQRVVRTKERDALQLAGREAERNCLPDYVFCKKKAWQ